MQNVTYRNRQGQLVTQTLNYVAPEVQGRIIGSGDIDRAYSSMGAAALRAWISQDSVYQRLTANAKQNVRNKGV
jgi:hypothetical protein